MTDITPCLWFDGNAEEAARFWCGLLPDSRITQIARAPIDNPSTLEGAVLTVEFELMGRPYLGLNGGPMFTFNEAISLQVFCQTQAEIDYYWDRLSDGGDPAAQACGWLKDRFGMSWQVVPTGMELWFKDGTTPATERAMEALLQMKKLDLDVLRRAYDGA